MRDKKPNNHLGAKACATKALFLRWYNYSEGHRRSERWCGKRSVLALRDHMYSKFNQARW